MIDSSGLEAWRWFLKAHAFVIAAIERDLERAGHVPLVWYDVLVAISGASDGRLRLKDLGSELVLTRSGATRLADKLEAAHLVERQRSADDRRGVTLTLTEQGRSALRRAWPVYAKGIRNGFLAKLSSEEVATLRGALSRVAQLDRPGGEE
ncbi:MAG: MarR family transcriptional regulator [Candidatus Dormibacteraeota bacterium]|nr:MarR family transcriptional regulator [Candidatus Dormibacteraeota bacterium]